jgi:hypothetical protein
MWWPHSLAEPGQLPLNLSRTRLGYNMDERKLAQTLSLEPGMQIVAERELGMEHVTR